MAIRKSFDITDINKLGMFDFYLEAANGYDETVLISGDRGYPYYYRVELQFFAVQYIACPPSFGDMGTFQFRQATEQETKAISENYLEDPCRTAYCIEEDLSRWNPIPKRKARIFFIVASKVEISIHYDAENINHLAGFEDTKNGE